MRECRKGRHGAIAKGGQSQPVPVVFPSRSLLADAPEMSTDPPHWYDQV